MQSIVCLRIVWTRIVWNFFFCYATGIRFCPVIKKYIICSKNQENKKKIEENFSDLPESGKTHNNK